MTKVRTKLFLLMKIEIPFSEVLICEEFESYCTKRHFHGIRVRDATIVIPDGHVGAGQKLMVNAVIAKDHASRKAHDAGILIQVSPDSIVAVHRSPGSGC
jgi:hypothetical protein